MRKNKANTTIRANGASNTRSANASIAKSELNSLLNKVKSEEAAAIKNSKNTNSNVKKLKLSGKLLGAKLWKSNIPIKSKVGMVYRLTKLSLSGKLKQTMRAIEDKTIDVNTMDPDLKTIFTLMIDDMIKSISEVGDDTSALLDLKEKLKGSESVSSSNQKGGGLEGDLIMITLECLGYLIFAILSAPYTLLLYYTTMKQGNVARANPVYEYSNPAHNMATKAASSVQSKPMSLADLTPGQKFSQKEYDTFPYSIQKMLTPHQANARGARFFYTYD
jgi:hypothetical protein